MPVKTGMVIFRHWDDKEGLSEISREFKSLDQLFMLCMEGNPHLLVDRVVIDGVDKDNSSRTLVLTFQSVTIQDSLEK